MPAGVSNAAHKLNAIRRCAEPLAGIRGVFSENPNRAASRATSAEMTVLTIGVADRPMSSPSRTPKDPPPAQSVQLACDSLPDDGLESIWVEDLPQLLVSGPSSPNDT